MQENLKAKGEISSARENQVSSVAALLPGIYSQRCAHAKLCSVDVGLLTCLSPYTTSCGHLFTSTNMDVCHC